MLNRVIIIFLFTLFLLSLFSSGVVDAQDGFQYLAVSRNIFYKGEPTAPVYEYGKENKWKNIHMSTYVGRDGKTYSLTGLGFSLAMLPPVALTDFVYKMYDVSPTVHFPLENDWFIFFSTSFINVFFASMLVVILYLYLIEIGVRQKNAIFISFLGLFTTNLFAFSKHITAHMMFLTFLFMSFFFLKKFSRAKKKIFLFLSGVAYGITIITYNNTFMLSAIPFALYYLLLIKPKANLDSARNVLRQLFFFSIGIFPSLIAFFWYESVRAPGVVYSSPSFLLSFAKTRLLTVPTTVFFEGLWGQLFSPGRSFFLYSPLLILPILFWHKIKKEVFPEVLVFGTLSIIYVVFFATLYSVGPPGYGFTGLWPGESSWGPRYLSPLIPFGILLVGYLYQRLKKIEKILVILPLGLIGLYIEILGVVLPYQIKYHYLDPNFFVNQTEYNSYLYSNLLPRYSPIIMQSKNLFRLINNLRNITSAGDYNVEMYDGVDFPFNVGPERWRRIENKGHISFDNPAADPVKEISFDMINHPIGDSKISLSVDFELNGQKPLASPVILKIGDRETINFDVGKIKINEKKNQLIIVASFADKTPLPEQKQISALIEMRINGKTVNKEYLTAPYVSELSQKMLGIRYQNWGGTNTSPWKTWDIHTQTFERFPDFWWFRNMFYWDVPKNLFIVLFVLNLAGVVFFGYRLKKAI